MDQAYPTGVEHGPIDVLFNAGIANELFPLLLFIGIGAMIDFGPLLANPKMMLFGAAAQFGIFFTLSLARFLGFSLEDAASVAIIGAADGPTSIFVSQYFNSNYIGAIIVAAYSYMALVPIVQPAVIKLITTKKERQIKMDYAASAVSKPVRILVPDSNYRNCMNYRAPLGSTGRLFDVRQPDSGMRRIGQPFPVGAKRTGEPDYLAVGSYRIHQNAVAGFPESADFDDYGPWFNRLYL